MKQILIILLFCSCVQAVVAQSRRSQEPRKEFLEHVWFGVNLNDLRFGNNTFSFGLAPMAAVEVVDNFSLGVMVRADYFYQRVTFSPPRIKFESLDLGPALFARVDVLEQYFAQLEYERASLERPQRDNAGNPIIDQNRNIVLTERLRQDYVYIGAGYSSGGDVQFMISLHYNLLDDFDSERIPWDYRFGIRWNLR